MAIKPHTIKAFRNRGIRINSTIKTPAPVKFVNALFSGYARNIDIFADYIANGCIIQHESMNGYVQFSYPEGKDSLLTQFKHDLIENGNSLRYIGMNRECTILPAI